MTQLSSAAIAATLPNRLYRAIWRWHFYAGLVVVPFLIALAATGLIMLYGNSVETFLGPKRHVAVDVPRASLVNQAIAAQKSIAGGKTILYVNPPSDDRASVFLVEADGIRHVVQVDPHGPAVIDSYLRDQTWFYWADKIHGTLLMGDVGDRLLEIAAGLGLVLVLTGLYLWWPRNGRGWAQALFPRLTARKRALWKEIHVTLGFYLSVLLVFFLISGLAWTGIWGTRIVQAWSTFPAAKWDNVPLSDKTHASMNHGAMKEVPWGLELTPMPASGSRAGATGLAEGTPINLDTVVAFAKANGFTQQFRVNLPGGADGVYTVSADSMDGDTTSPTGDHTVHIDQYTGRLLARIDFADYGWAAKAMAVGTALHQGNLGLWNTVLNAVYCLAVIFICVSGVVMWWMRRPAGKLGAPLYPRDYRIPRAILVIAALVAVAFPLTGIAVLVFATIDFLLPRRLKEIGFHAG
jgi:uncharacterized iron-regulated membrane protein